jgi:beta-glucosidase
MKIRTVMIMLTGISILVLSGCGARWTEVDKEDYHYVVNPHGANLGYSPESGVTILTVQGLAFKDLNHNGELDPYEDWRLQAEQRAHDLATRMTIEQISGLMLYSAHQAIPGGGFTGPTTYNGTPYNESGADPSDLTDQQKAFLTNDNLRHVLITRVESPVVAAQWNNKAQALVESLHLGIPVNSSSDPRHQASADQEFTAGAGGDISMWPPSLGLAATFDPSLVQEFGTIASIEYRALGIATALSPQVDLASEPRWFRFSGTFGISPELSADLARAYIDGFQTSSKEKEISGGWGYESVNAMAKHWPGGGSGEGGRDAHYGFGKYAVFPGNNLLEIMTPFLKGAFALKGPTGKVASIMPYYTISFNQDPSGQNVGNAYSRYFITTLLRDKYGFDGVVCTDWGVTHDEQGMDGFGRTPWGVESLSVPERHYKILMAGCDQFGGNNDAAPVIEAFNIGVKEHGEEYMRKRFDTSAVRLLKNMFRTGLFENPYLNVRYSDSVVGNPEFMQKGYEAQQKSVVLLKNKGSVLPLKKVTRVYIPRRYRPPSSSFFGQEIPGKWEDPINPELASRYVTVTDDPDSADVALVVIYSPDNGRTAGYSREDVAKGGNGFVPISLQYRPYTATEAREMSIAGDPRKQDVLNRTYKNKTVRVTNESDLDLVLNTKKKMKGKPVIVILKLSNPTVVKEFESEIDGLLINFMIQDQAILDVITGRAEPSGLLPLQMPADMITVEKQMEDMPFDLQPYVDSEGNAYDFAFGLNWNGVISDERTEKYQHKE